MTKYKDLTNAARQARFREESGLVKVSVWVPPQDRKIVLEYGHMLREKMRGMDPQKRIARKL